MGIIPLVSLCVVAAFITVFLRRALPEYAMVITLITGVIILFLLMNYFREIVNRINGMLSQTGLTSDYTSILFKGIGVCIITQLASDTCNDVGETALAKKSELAGKVLLLLLALPLFEKVTEIAVSFMAGGS